MLFELGVVVVVEAFDRCVADCAGHAFDLAVRLGVFGLGHPVLDAERGAGVFDCVGPEVFALGQSLGDQRGCRSACSRRCEMGPIVGHHDVDLVGHGRDKIPEKIGSRFAQGFTIQLDEDEFAQAVNGHDEMVPALRRLDLGSVDMDRTIGAPLVQAQWRGPIV